MKLYCEKCDKFEEVTLKKVKDKFLVKNMEVEAEVTISVCNVCGEEVYNEEAEKQNDIVVFDAFKKTNL